MNDPTTATAVPSSPVLTANASLAGLAGGSTPPVVSSSAATPLASVPATDPGLTPLTTELVESPTEQAIPLVVPTPPPPTVSNPAEAQGTISPSSPAITLSPLASIPALPVESPTDQFKPSPSPASAELTAPTVSTSSAPSPLAASAMTMGMSEGITKINRELKEKAVSEQAKRLGLGYSNIDKVPINPDLASIIPHEQAKTAMLVPFFRIGKKLRVALHDPQKPETVALLAALQQQDYLLNLNLASDEGILNALDRLYASADKAKVSILVTQVNESEIQAYEQEIQTLSQLTQKLKTITAEEGLNLINVGAMKTGASDIHFQPEETGVVVRFRIDGVLQKVVEMEQKTFANLVNQLKYKAGMKLNIANEPQDGRYHFVLNNRKIDVRVSALPTEFGETFVCRLLDSGRGFLGFDQSGFIGRNLKLMNRAIGIAHGMILVTGPTGSGKTSTLYSMLSQFNTPERKVITLEDPIEYHLPGISQSQINEKRGYNFADGLRAILRQDPDVVMVGEIRDLETAETAVQAALTGHVLLSTIHTNSAIETIPRLINIGLPPFMVAPSLHMIVAQRLVRKLCELCRKKEPITVNEQKILEEARDKIAKVGHEDPLVIPTELWHPVGCEKCSHTGYAGRLGIHEIMLIDEPIRHLILNQSSSNDIILKAREQGMLTMREDGLIKVMSELTTLEEVQRVTQVI
ncbi:MAG: Tfp pilus assembly protein PilB [Candidatus Peregrinibacteria bacterium GW2011_GWA2_44_7]|nr:MAG: Tfp pilus assembly protein PilB [Candidatus Peregrinibacteria bacterium GW2011_GWA2_44_7]